MHEIAEQLALACKELRNRIAKLEDKLRENERTMDTMERISNETSAKLKDAIGFWKTQYDEAIKNRIKAESEQLVDFADTLERV